jgi:hypothetical protein
MSLKKCLIFLASLTVLSWIVFLFLLFKLNPESSDWASFLLFYFSLFLSLSGSLNLLSFIIKRKISKKAFSVHLIESSFRQSFLLSFFIITILLMLAENLFSWLNILIIIIILSIIEYALIKDKK